MSRQARFHFVNELNDFLSPEQRGEAVTCAFNAGQSVKHLVESIGVPHTEIARILVNDTEADFAYQVADGDQVEVFPVSSVQLRPEQMRFILDNHLGRLAVYLRMLGFDASYRNDFHDEELARLSHEQERLLLTRDRRLLMRNLVSRGYWVRNKIPREQLLEVVRRFGLQEAVVPFQRCMRCNGVLQPVEKETVLDRLEPLTRQYYDEFHICTECGQVYWKGSHYERMQEFITLAVRANAR